MIIGEALGRLFKDLSIDFKIDGDTVNKSVKYHYGDHKELVKWIADKKGSKYPLIWYVIAPYKEEPNDKKNVTSRIIIFQQTNADWFNTKRSVKSYDDIIEPTWKAVKNLLEKSRFIDIIGDSNNMYEIKDEPNYGVNTNDIRLSQNDFSNKTSKGSESVSLDVVDGRIITLNFRIETNPKTECRNGC